MLVHCMGGKDRTGLVAALLLRLAGVPVADIAADYGLSAENIKPLWQEWVEDAGDENERELRRRLSASPADAMAQVLETLEREHGSVEAYLLDAGVDSGRAGARPLAHALVEPRAELAQEARVDRVLERRLAVHGVGEELVRLPAPLHADHRVEGAVADRDRRKRRRQVELESVDRRDEAAEGEHRGGARPALSEAERVRHHRSLREAADHRALGREAERVDELGERRVRLEERVAVRIADLAAPCTSARLPAGARAARAA